MCVCCTRVCVSVWCARGCVRECASVRARARVCVCVCVARVQPRLSIHWVLAERSWLKVGCGRSHHWWAAAAAASEPQKKGGLSLASGTEGLGGGGGGEGGKRRGASRCQPGLHSLAQKDTGGERLAIGGRTVGSEGRGTEDGQGGSP